MSSAFLAAAVCPAEAVLRPVFNELCFNLESFNPAFAACLLQVNEHSVTQSQSLSLVLQWIICLPVSQTAAMVLRLYPGIQTAEHLLEGLIHGWCQ